MQWLTPAGMAFSNGASSSTTNADLPPSSRHTFLMPSPATAATRLPGASEPVKLTMSMPGCAEIASPTTRPCPTRRSARRPAGRSRARPRRAMNALSGASSAGFKHHGAAGRQRRGDLADDLMQRVVPRRDAADDADRLLHDQRVAELLLEAGVRGRTSRWPRASRPGTRPALWWRSRGRCRLRGRWPWAIVGHARLHRGAELLEPRRRAPRRWCAPHAPSKARRAAAAAASTSAAVPRGTRPTTCSVDDDTTSIASSPEDGRQSPSMKIRS